VPGLWHGTQAVETAIAAADLDTACAAARALVRSTAAAEAWLLLGVVQHRLGRLRRAERILRRALRCDHESPEVHNRLGILLVASGRVEAGRLHLQHAHLLAPHDPSPLLHLAQACALLGQSADAAAHLAAAERCGADPQVVALVRREVASSQP
jgi:Flp pilus assembly protein TadD